MASMMLATSSSWVMPTLPTATPRQRTFLSWNLMVDLTSLTLEAMSSLWETGVGNLPAVWVISILYQKAGGHEEQRGNIPLERPGPKRRGICLMRPSEARKASYLRASFLMSFLFLFSFLRSSADMASMPWCLARSRSCWSPRTLYYHLVSYLFLEWRLHRIFLRFLRFLFFLPGVCEQRTR